MRLNRFLAQAGLGSRRACEELIRQGRVQINGRFITDLATQVEAGDQVKAGSRLLHQVKSFTAILHKPRGFICTADDPEARRTIYDLIPREWPRVFYVGRLDTDSEGLLLLTNDGDLSEKLAHPRYKLPKTYEVTLDREFDADLGPHFIKGFVMDGQRARMEEIHRLGPYQVKVVLTQGMKRQIRLMFQRLGFTVTRLVRTQIGGCKLGRLRPGEWKILSDEDVARYFKRSTERLVSRSRPGDRAVRAPRQPADSD